MHAPINCIIMISYFFYISLGNGLLSDYGIMHLSALPLVQLSLSSFHAITDYSIKSLMKMTTLKQITLVDMPQITDRVVSEAINLCVTDQSRKLHLTLSDEQMSKRLRRRRLAYPTNLLVNFDTHLCGKQLADSEPTDIQMILVILMSTIILGMTLLTTVVVVLVPLSMLFMMAHEWLIESFFSQYESSNVIESVIRLFSTANGSSTASTTTTTGLPADATGPSSFIFGFFVSFVRKLFFPLSVK